MCDEQIVSSQRTLQSLTTRVPVIVLQRVGERFSAVRESLVCTVCVWGGGVRTEENCIVLVLRVNVAKGTKCFLGSLC